MSSPEPTAEPFTVIVPAHDEEAVIGGTLRTLLDGWPHGERPRVIVVCNGCLDATADAARRAAPEVEVVELSSASKTAAINEGLARTRAFPVIVVDADVGIAPPSLRALAAALREPGVMAASPAARIDTAGSDGWTRAYYRVWARHPYLTAGVGGAGAYGLSREGAARIGRFPEVLADDSFVRRSFPLTAQRRVTGDAANPVFAHVKAPARVGGLIACEARWQAGNIELRGRMEGSAEEQSTPVSGAGLGDRAVHLGVKLAGRMLHALDRARGRGGRWHRGRED